MYMYVNTAFNQFECQWSEDPVIYVIYIIPGLNSDPGCAMHAGSRIRVRIRERSTSGSCGLRHEAATMRVQAALIHLCKLPAYTHTHTHIPDHDVELDRSVSLISFASSRCVAMSLPPFTSSDQSERTWRKEEFLAQKDGCLAQKGRVVRIKPASRFVSNMLV